MPDLEQPTVDTTAGSPPNTHPLAPWSLTPSTLAEAQDYATLIAQSDLVPADYRNQAANVLVAVQMGAELGLKPLQALQGIAIINGRPCLWGDALIAVVRASPLCEWVRETLDEETATATCTAKRRGQPEESRTFSWADASRAGLTGRSGPWQQYPKRMLQLRARAFCLRDVFPDVLKGLAVAEEMSDVVDVQAHGPAFDEPPSEGRTAALSARLADRQAKVLEAADTGAEPEPAAPEKDADA